VHTALYQGARELDVDFGAYLQDLCASIANSLNHDDRISVEVEAESVVLPVDSAVPLGMVVNELVTNAVKYAYPPPSRGPIRVEFKHDGPGLRLTVKDRGRGLPSVGEDRSGGVGMRLVRSLVAQAQGKLTVVRSRPGAAFVIRLPSNCES
jgi:two-component sensor histidine kinase